MKTTRFYKWILLCTIALFGSKAIAQTSFTVTDRVLGNSGSLDVILASAVTSANAGNNVTVYFNVTPDANGNALCIIDAQLTDIEPTNGSILMTTHGSSTIQQGMQFEDNLAFQKIFRAKGTNVHISKLVIKKAPKHKLSMVNYSELKREHTSGYATAVEGKVKFTFTEEYKIETGKYLSYKVYNENHEVMGSCTSSGTVTGGASKLACNFDDNRYILDISAITGTTTNSYYELEVETSTGEKRYLRILYKN